VNDTIRIAATFHAAAIALSVAQPQVG